MKCSVGKWRLSPSAGRGLPMIALLASLSTLAPSVSAQSTIKRPGAHPRYSFEAEPHLIFRDDFGHDDGGFGPGFRGTIPVVHNGFISTINNSVGIGFGADAVLFGDEHCHGNGNNVDYCHNHSQIVLPVVLQWNFWLHRSWSVFGEPGLGIILRDEHGNDDVDLDPFLFYAGGRWHFSDAAALTMRLGIPSASFSIGVSFLL